jgi:ribosomal protein L37AE/L43A
MSKHYDPIDAPSLDILNCNYCQEATEHHRYLVKGWICKRCNQ